ncbi:hypothetical protein ACJMK2_006175 [Sinanodonta woodiana]|uniref:PH domain-containing protein n=1 Tax=Sinanodonta woodiana TaxID=1069815 RepID=A0ABD3VTZ7_SINWO
MQNLKMNTTAIRKRKRTEEESPTLDSSFTVEGCGFMLKRRRKCAARLHIPVEDKENIFTFEDLQAPQSECMRPTWTPSKANLRRSLRRRVSMSVLRSKLKRFKDYSLPDVDYLYVDSLVTLNKCTTLPTSKGRWCRRDPDLQQKIDHEIKMREGTARLLAASKHPAQMIEAAKNLLTSNNRIISYMSELQRRKTVEATGRTLPEGSQLPCKAKIGLSDLRIPLMWKDTDHFKNKGDYRRYAVFCLVKIGTEIYDTSMINNVDRSSTDIAFEDVIVFDNVPHDFECSIEIYCHKLHEDLTIASTPKKIKKRFNDLSESVGRSVGKRLSGLHDSDIMGSMVLGPKFELVARGNLQLKDVDDSVRTFDLTLEASADGTSPELPLFGHYCCRLAALPYCLVQSAVTGFLNLQEDDDLSKWRRYWCVLKNLQLACWSSPADVEVTEPLLIIPVTKNTQISDADPRTCKRSQTFHVKTVQSRHTSEYTLAADTKEELSTWWDGFQQHLLDQALWKQACDYMMDIAEASPHRRKGIQLRKSSIYDETPLETSSSKRRISSNLKKEEDQLSQMLTTLMGEAKEIRGDSSQPSS